MVHRGLRARAIPPGALSGIRQRISHGTGFVLEEKDVMVRVNVTILMVILPLVCQDSDRGFRPANTVYLISQYQFPSDILCTNPGGEGSEWPCVPSERYRTH